VSRADAGLAPGHPDDRLFEPGPDEVLDRPAAPPPGVLAAVRRAAVDLYYQSIRMVPANVAWGLAVVLTFFVAVNAGLLPGLVAAALTAVAWVGVVRLSAQTARGVDVVLSDAFWAWRRWLVPSFLIGAAFVAGAALLWFNILIGLYTGGLVGWALATMAAWGLAFGWLFGLAFWPILVDPRRDGISTLRAARLAMLLVLARPRRIWGMGIVLAIIAAISAVLVAAILTITAAWIGLSACHVVLPAADELEERLAGRA
jgi:uncharacterized membrane protein YesL